MHVSARCAQTACEYESAAYRKRLTLGRTEMHSATVSYCKDTHKATRDPRWQGTAAPRCCLCIGVFHLARLPELHGSKPSILASLRYQKT